VVATKAEATRWLKDQVSAQRRRQLVSTRLKARAVTAGLRALPDFLIIGGQRCGTSSLYKHLGAHRQVVPSLRKETEYFSTRFGEGESWYRSHFPLRTRLAVGHKATFEATPDYMLDPRAPGRAADLVPDARIIAMVRDPVERAYSQYQHNRRLGHEPLTFEEALAAEGERIAGEIERLSADQNYRAIPLRRHAYIGRGMYADQLRGWFGFFPPERTLVVKFEDLIESPADTMRGIERFLGIDDWIPPTFTNHSYGRAGRTVQTPMPEPTRKHLQAVFAPANRDLETLLDRRFGWSVDEADGSG